MIHYALICEEGHRFDGWFSSSAGFDDQRAAGQLICPHCGSRHVDRALMAPNVRVSPDRRGLSQPGEPEAPSEAPPSDGSGAGAPKTGEVLPPHAPPKPVALSDGQMAELRAAATALRKAVEEHATNVGARFPEEARRIHYGESQERPIYGQASLDDVRDLVDEGIEVLPIPGRVADSN